MTLPLLIASSVLAAGGGNPPCALQFYDNFSEWSTATSNQVLRVTFEEPVWPVNAVLTGAWSLNGLTFQGFAGAPVPNIYIANFGNPFGSGQWLTANGDESVDITPGLPTNAMAFEAASNSLGSATITVFDQDNTLLGSLLLPIETVRFVGITSSAPIGRIHFASTLGAIQNTGFDDVRTADFEPETPADLNHDGLVDGADLGLLLSEWGQCPPVEGPCCTGDLTGDGTVDGADLGTLLAAWGS